MHTIPEILNFPNKTPIDAVQGTVSAVYDRKMINTRYGQKPLQALMIQDVAGNKIRVKAWDHDDLEVYKGKDIILSAGGQGKGLEVEHDSYTDKDGNQKNTTNLSVSKAGRFQIVEVRAAAEAAAPAAKNPPAAPVAHAVIRGEKVGMAINNAVAFMTGAGEPFDAKRLWEIASGIVKVSTSMEQGKLYSAEAVAEAKKAAAYKKLDNTGPEPANDDDIPF